MCKSWQDLREEEGDADMQHNVRLALRNMQGKGKKDKEVGRKDYGRPWQTHEAFTIILKQQVKALTAHGASPKLEDIVFRLWTLYLSKIGVAFDTSQCITHVQLKGRDLRAGTLADPEVKPLQRRRTFMERGFTQHLQQGDTLLAQHSMPTTEDEEFYEGDSPLEENTDLTESTENYENENDESKAYTTQLRQVGYMSMQKTVCFCYLGLCHTNSLVQPTDLLRWIQSGRIPYGKKATDLLPDDMKFGTNDASTFCVQDLPSADKIRSLTGSLANFLGIKNFPKVSLEHVASRFILELNLPGELHGLLRNLMKRHPIELQRAITWSQHKSAPYAVLAMSYLIILLKLILGLDDHTEKELSTYAGELSQIVTLAQPLFVWHEWAQYMEMRTAHLGYQRLPCNTRDVKGIRHVDQCLKVYRELSDQKGRRKIVKKKRSNTRRAEVCETLQEPFVQLLERLKLHAAHAKCTEHHNVSIAVNNNDLLQAMYDEDISPTVEHAESSCTGSREKDFSVCTLRYITEDVNFFSQLESLGLSNTTIHSSCVDSDPDNSDCCFFDSAMDSLQPKLKRKKSVREQVGSRHKGKTVAKVALQQKVTSLNAAKPITMSAIKRAQIEELLKRRIHAYQSYTLCKESQMSTGYGKVYKHRSYTWLLDLCSKHIDCDASFLHKHICQLEMLLIIDEDELCTRTKWLKSAFQRNYLC